MRRSTRRIWYNRSLRLVIISDSSYERDIWTLPIIIPRNSPSMRIDGPNQFDEQPRVQFVKVTQFIE